MPILGVVASGITNNLDDYVHINTITVGAGGQSTIDFGTISTQYKHLELRGVVRSTGPNNSDALILNLNGSRSNYTHYLYGGPGVSSGGVSSATTRGNCVNVAGGNQTANVFSSFFIKIFDYASTNKKKVAMSFGGYMNVSSVAGEQSAFDNVFNTTSAITTVSFICQSTATSTTYNFAENSSISLFGIKG